MPLSSCSCAVKLPPNYLTTIIHKRRTHIPPYLLNDDTLLYFFPPRPGRVLILTHDTTLFTNAFAKSNTLHLYLLLNPRMQCSKRQVEVAVCACIRGTLSQLSSLGYAFPLPPLPGLLSLKLYHRADSLLSSAASLFVHPTPSRNHMVLYGPTRLYVCAQYNTALSRSTGTRKVWQCLTPSLANLAT
jgi:hypothetical protein